MNKEKTHIVYKRSFIQVRVESIISLESLMKREKIPIGDFYVIRGNRLVETDGCLHPEINYHVIPRLFGGKGGFGSMLRAIGAQIEKTTNREACRDLSGRRMRDVNNEQQLREWVKDKAEREREKEERRKERAEKRKQALTDRRHNFDDRDYFQQKMQVLEELDDALMQGLQKAKSSAPAAEGASKERKGRKRKHKKDPGPDAIKKACEWLGVDMVNLSDLSSSDSDGSDDSGSDLGEGTSASGSAYRGGPIDARSLESMDVAGLVTENPSDQPSSSQQTDKSENETSQKDSPSSTDKGKGIGKKSGLLGALSTLPPKDNDSSSQNVSQQNATIEKENKNDKEDKSTENADEKKAPEIDPMEPVDLDAFESTSQLEELGLERLKQALITRGLKCGGTLQQRAERLFAVKGKSKDEIDPSLFAKPAKKKNKK